MSLAPRRPQLKEVTREATPRSAQRFTLSIVATLNCATDPHAIRLEFADIEAQPRGNENAGDKERRVYLGVLVPGD
jgi:hypothetical protein